MSLKVLYNLKFLFCPVGTVEAVKWQLICVGQVMMAETRRPAECPLAYGAHIRSLLTVLSLMCLEEEACLESLSTLLAYKGTLVSVTCLPVDAQGIGTVGAVLTVLTCIRFGTCVFCHVILQLVDPFAFVATFWAEILAFLHVNPHMIL